MTFQSVRTITARTPHRCDAGCRQPIVPGERYTKIAGVWDGDFYAVQMHEDCDWLRDALREVFDPYNEGMDPDLVECISDAGLSARERDAILAEHRGHYPRAVCRLELAMRRWSGEEAGDA